MQTSTDRILTTHTGSLPRPKPLIDLILRREKDAGVTAQVLEAEVSKATDDVVAKQVAAGIDVVSDGEMSKPSSTSKRSAVKLAYVKFNGAYLWR